MFGKQEATVGASFAEAVIRALPPGSPVPGYLRRLLLSADSAGRAFGRLVTTSTVDDLLDRARRRMELRFAEPVPAGVFDGVPGVAAVEVHDRTALLAVDGPVGPAMRAAIDAGTLLRVNPAGDDLEDLFVSLYQHSDQPIEVS